MHLRQQFIKGVAAPLLEDGLPVPPLSAKRVPIWEFYRLDFDQDGCPMKRMPDGRLEFHPILAPYLVADYVDLYIETKNQRCLSFATRIMDLALSRADPNRREITFTYKQSSGLSSMPMDFFSALTQSWYLRALAMLDDQYPGRYSSAIRRTFESLLIPVSEGGVLLKKQYGWIVEEYPADPPLYTLNGWLTALRWILTVMPTLRRCGINCDEFMENNLRAVDHLLPLYDAQFCWNSRYQLTGFSRLKFVADRSGTDLECSSLIIDIDGENPRKADLLPEGTRNRWGNYIEKSTGRMAQFNIVLSLVSYPEPNRYDGIFNVGKDCCVSVYVADGDYRPDQTGLSTTRWREVCVHKLTAGENRLKGCIPFDDRNMFSYPTNFKKNINGEKYNAYHFLHIVDLAILYQMSGRSNYAETARKWMQYISEWPKMPELSDPQISHASYLYGTNFEMIIEKHLSSANRRI